MTAPALRALFLNENIGGHATVHKNLETAFKSKDDIDATIVSVPKRGLARQLFDQPIPGLDRLDLDFQALRGQLAAAVVARRLLAPPLQRGVGADYDVLHVYTQTAAYLSAGILRQWPTVVSTDSTAALNAERLPYRRPGRFTPQAIRAAQVFERRVLRASTLLVANTKWVADSLVVAGVPADRIELIPFGIDLPSELGRPSDGDRPHIAFVGYTLDRKGGRTLLALHQAHLRDACDLVLVTKDAVEPTPGVIVRNDVVPGDGKLEQIFSTTTVMVFPSVIDQAPNAVLEAMACGVPVIAFRVAGVPEMIEDGVSGVLVDAGDEDGLLRAIRSVISDPVRAAEMGAAARERVRSRYDMAAIVDQLDGVLHAARRLHERHGPIG